MSDSSKVNPFIGERAFSHQPSLPDVEKREELGSGIVTRLLGHGGMANVYEIWVPKLEVYRAVKIIKPDCTKDALDRFQTEIKILAKLAHSNIIHIHSVGEWKGLPYIEMDKIDGWTLTDLIHEKGALPVEVCTAIAVLTTRAMAFAHTHEFQLYGTTYPGVVHRDLKPGNIMLTRDGELILMDFGVARPMEVSFHTVDGAVVGTIQYMSPELMAGKPLDFRTDIYALGATIYEILTSVNPFPEQNFSRLVSLKQKNKYRNLNEFAISIPGKLKRIVHKCMNYDPDKRFKNTNELLKTFEKVHTKLTHEKPEKILQKYVASLKPGNKYVPSTQFYLSPKLVTLLTGIFLTLSLMTLGIFQILENAKEERAQEMASRAAEVSQKVDIQDKGLKAATDNDTTQNIKNNSVDKQTAQVTKKSVSKPVTVKKKTTPKTAPVKPKVVTKPVTIDKDKPLGEQLATKYGTSDLHEILMREYNSRNYSNVLVIYEEIPFRELTDKDKLIKMRVLQSLGKNKELTRFISGGIIDDAEFYLARAINAYNSNALRAASSNLEKSLSAPKKMIDYTSLKRQVSYYRAKIASKKFDSAPGKKTYMEALEEWRNFGALYSNDRSSSKYKEYRDETRRLGAAYQSLQ